MKTLQKKQKQKQEDLKKEPNSCMTEQGESLPLAAVVVVVDGFFQGFALGWRRVIDVGFHVDCTVGLFVC